MKLAVALAALLVLSAPAFAAPPSSSSSSSGFRSSAPTPSPSFRPTPSPSSGLGVAPKLSAPSTMGLAPKPTVNPPSGLAPKPVVNTTAPATSSQPNVLGLAPKPSNATTAPPAGLAPKPTANSTPISAPAAKPNATTTAASRASAGASLAAYQQQVASSKLPPAPAVSPAAARSSTTYVNVTHNYTSRSAYYRDYERGWSSVHYPVYLAAPRPYYGIYTGNIFAMALMADTASNLAWLYSMQHSQDAANQAAYRQWRTDMDQQAASNAELRAKLAAMDAKLTTMQAPAKAPELPDGVTPVMAIAPATVLQDTALADDDSGGYSWFWWLLGLLVVAFGFYAVIQVIQRGQAVRQAR